ncbi:ATP-binding cassette domain-containing protein [Sulfolobus tengchongensis]|uniref:ATP-binding cassette domain-containing protein n=1 Tax=Sulfolobus tengchongensis TaxID=207809 RepID=A0AAX4L1Q9_9CREN
MKFVEIRDLQVTYLGKDKPSLVIDKLDIEEGESVLVTGKSGSGKSTLTSVINGVIPHLINAEIKGEVKVFGLDVKVTPIHEISKYVGTLLQDPDTQAFNYTVIDEVAFGVENYMISRDEMVKRIEEAMKVTGITHLKDREINTLSGGELQRTILASVLAMRPKALILDEPTSNIDPQGTREILELIKTFRSEGISLIIVEHKIERVLPFVDRIIIVDNGKIAMDLRKDEIVDKADLLYSLGLEVPDYMLFLKKSGSKKIDYEYLRKTYTYKPPSRVEGKREILSARVKIKTKTGRYIVDTKISVKEGTITALMGKNGSGKTTLLKAIIGLIDRKRLIVEEEKIIIDGIDLSKSKLVIRGEYIAYLPQFFDVMFVKRTVEDEIKFSMKNRKNFDPNKLEDILKSFSLEAYRKEDPLILSMGQRRRVAMASVLAGGAKLILMDEPTSGQDWHHRQILGKELLDLRDKGYTILVVTHDSRFVDRFADRLMIMSEGKIVLEGKPEEVFSKSTIYGIEPPLEYELGGVIRNEQLS